MKIERTEKNVSRAQLLHTMISMLCKEENLSVKESKKILSHHYKLSQHKLTSFLRLIDSKFYAKVDYYDKIRNKWIKHSTNVHYINVASQSLKNEIILCPKMSGYYETISNFL